MKAVVWRRSRSSEFFSIFSSKQCMGRSAHDWRRLSTISRAVSVAAQKYGGDSHHPICRELGTTIYVSSRVAVGDVDGII